MTLKDIQQVSKGQDIVINMTDIQMFVAGWAIDAMDESRPTKDDSDEPAYCDEALPRKEHTTLTIPAHADRSEVLADLLYRLEDQAQDVSGVPAAWRKSAKALATRIRAYAGTEAK